MADPMNGPITRCPWCSAELPDPGVDTCPSCQATLAATPGAEGDIKGVTTLDTEAILRARSEISRPRSRLLSFITGEQVPETGGPASPGSLARPPHEVRREMLRLQIEAEQADLEAEAVALKADELARRGIHLSALAGHEAAPEGEAATGPEAPGPEATPEGEWPAELAPEDAPEEPARG